MNIKTFWAGYLNQTGQPSDLTYSSAFHLGTNKAEADQLVKLILNQKSTAILKPLTDYPSQLPQPGQLAVITDYQGNPQCVIEIVSVMLVAFTRINRQIIQRSQPLVKLKDWQAKWLTINQKAGKAETPVVIIDFKLVYPLIIKAG